MADEDDEIEYEEPELDSDRQMDIIKEQELDKREQAMFDIGQVRLNAENILKVIEVQLTKVLMDITEIEKQIEFEVEQYWMKELPIQTLIKSYLRSIGSLINLYNQQEQLYRKVLEDISTGVEYPDYVKIEEIYLDKINEVENRMEIMKDEFLKNYQDLKEQTEMDKETEIKKAIVKTHDEYEEQLTKLEMEFEEKDKKIEELSSKVSEFKKNMPSGLSMTQIVDDVGKKGKDEKTPLISGAVIDKPEIASSSAVEYFEPEHKPKKHPAVEEFFDTIKYVRKGKVIQIPDHKNFKKEFFKLILKLMWERYTYDEIKKMLTREFSAKTFFRYLTALVDDGWLVKEGRGKKTILKYITPASKEEQKKRGIRDGKEKDETKTKE